MYIIGLIYQNIFTGVFNTLYVDCNFDANRYSGKVKEVRIFQVGLIPIETLADTYNFTTGFLED